MSEGKSALCSAPVEARPLDLVHLSRYTLGDRGLEAELLGLFRAQAGLYISRLETAADDKEWRDAAHSLKGSARGLGAWALGDVAEEAEHMTVAADREQVIVRLRDAIADVNGFIDGLMA